MYFWFTPCCGRGDKLQEYFSLANAVKSTASCIQNFQKGEALCSRRHLRHVPNYLNEHVLYLDLSYNEISNLFNNSLLRYSHLEDLLLMNNDLTFIETATFYTLKNLETLRLGNNRNLILHSSDIFRWSKRLRALDLGGCSLQYFPNDTLRWLPLLQDLDLRNNHLNFINFTHCPRNDSLITVSLDNNNISLITTVTFSFTCKCKHLRLNDNILQIVDPYVFSNVQVLHFEYGFSHLSQSGLPVSAVRDLFKGIGISSIMSVTLTYDLTGWVITPGLNDGHELEPLRNKSLDKFAIHGYSFLYFNPYTFENLTHIQELEISSTSMINVTTNYFNDMTDLRVLDLHGNNIGRFNPSLARWDLNISVLNLSNNCIYVLSNRMFTGLNSLLKLDVSHNMRLTFNRFSMQSLRYLDVSASHFRVMGDFDFPNLRYFVYSEKERLGEPFSPTK